MHSMSQKYFSFVGIVVNKRIMLMHQQKKYLFVQIKTKQTEIGTHVMCITPLFGQILKV